MWKPPSDLMRLKDGFCETAGFEPVSYTHLMLALFYMTLKLVFPLIVSGYQSGVRLLHIDEHGVVYRIAVEAGDVYKRQGNALGNLFPVQVNIWAVLLFIVQSFSVVIFAAVCCARQSMRAVSYPHLTQTEKSATC